MPRDADNPAGRIRKRIETLISVARPRELDRGPWTPREAYVPGSLGLVERLGGLLPTYRCFAAPRQQYIVCYGPSVTPVLLRASGSCEGGDIDTRWYRDPAGQDRVREYLAREPRPAEQIERIEYWWTEEWGFREPPILENELARALVEGMKVPGG